MRNEFMLLIYLVSSTLVQQFEWTKTSEIWEKRRQEEPTDPRPVPNQMPGTEADMFPRGLKLLAFRKTQT